MLGGKAIKEATIYIKLQPMVLSELNDSSEPLATVAG